MMKNLFQLHAGRYPAMQAIDALKLLYQSAYGPGHLIQDPEQARAWLIAEAESAPATDRRWERLSGGFARLYPGGLSREELDLVARMFVRSAQEIPGGDPTFAAGLSSLRSLTAAGKLPFSTEELEAALKSWESGGRKAFSHSELYRKTYHPVYRVLLAPYAWAFPVFAAIDQLLRRKETVTVALEGGAATGKSTLGDALAEFFGAALLHTDDFFLRSEQRTPERYAQPGGNIDYERMKAELLDPLNRGEHFAYRPFDCGTMSLGDPVEVEPRRLRIVEGCYSMHPALHQQYDLKVFLSASREERRRRILQRSGPVLLSRFLSEWIPLENRYFEHFQIAKHCDLILEEAEG